MGLLAAAAAGAAPAHGNLVATPGGPYVITRADPRLCPSPMCGGIWVQAVNTGSTTCGDGARKEACYAASADLSRLRVNEKGRVLLQQAITQGRAVARGRLVRGLVEGFPDLDTLVVSEVWRASSSVNRARGVFHRLRDNGVRCVKAPCFSITAAVLNSSRSRTVSDVELSRTGTPAAERRRALARLAAPGLIAAGRIVRAQEGGRAFVATQFYVRAQG